MRRFTVIFTITDGLRRLRTFYLAMLQTSTSAESILKPPTTQPWGRRSVWLPDCNVINFSAPATP